MAKKATRRKSTTDTKRGKGKPPKRTKARTVRVRHSDDSVEDVLIGKPDGAVARKPRRKRAETESFTPDQPVELGPLTIPEGKDAERALLEIATANDAAIQAKKASDEQAEKAKRAKKKYEDAMAEVHRLVKLYTHPSDLPLFADLDQRERDQAAMEAASGSEITV